MNTNLGKISHVDLLLYSMREKLGNLRTSKQTNSVYPNLPRILSLEDQREVKKEQRRDSHMKIYREFFSNTSINCVQNYWFTSEEVVLMDIHTAASLGDCGGIDAALARNENINYCSHITGWTPLMFAAGRNHLVAVKHLIFNGANVCTHSKRQGLTALHLAAGGSYETVKVIADETVKQNLGIDSWDIYGWTALMFAIYFGSSDAVNLLVKNNANVNVSGINGETPLMLAVECMRDDIVYTLLNAGADQSASTKRGWTAAKYAELFGYRAIINMLKAARDFKSEWNNESLRPVILILATLDLSQYIQIFIKHNIDIKKFNLLTEDELRGLGLTNMGPRKKVLSAIRDCRTETK